MSLGARQIAVAGAPPVGCVPSQRLIAGGVRRQCATDRNQLALLYNRKLNQEINKLAGRLPGVNIFYMDLYSILADMIQRYHALGKHLINTIEIISNTYEHCIVSPSDSWMGG